MTQNAPKPLEVVKPPAPPKYLSKRSRALWRDLVATFSFDVHHYELLRLALEALDRAEQARELLAADGPVVYPKNGGAPRKHPAISIEESARIAAARLFRELNLEPAAGESRPPRTGGARW